MGRGVMKYLGYLGIYRLQVLHRLWLMVGYMYRLTFHTQPPDCTKRKRAVHFEDETDYGYHE